MDRRRLLLTSVADALAAPLACGAQVARKRPDIGALSPSVPEKSQCLSVLRRGLSALGYREGETHELTVHWPTAGTGSSDQAASELVKERVDVIVSFAGDLSISAVKQATAMIPLSWPQARTQLSEGSWQLGSARRKPHGLSGVYG